MFINRDHSRTEKDDFNLNVLPRLDSGTEAVPITSDLPFQAECDPTLIGWTIQPRGE
jgi:hypothetical protein